MSDKKKDSSVIKKCFDFDIITNAIYMIFSKPDFNMEDFQHTLTDSLYDFKLVIWKRNVGKVEEFPESYIPKTWKDHFKRKHRFKRWMSWWIKRKPIKYLSIKRTTIYPDVRIPSGDKNFLNELSYYEADPYKP